VKIAPVAHAGRPEPLTAAKRIVLAAATFAGVAIGLFLAAFQVQGWTMPRLIGIVLISLLGLMAAAAISVIVFEIVKACRRFLEHRATTAAWFSAERPGLLDYEADGTEASNRFTRALEHLGRDTAKLGTKLEKHTKRFERLTSASGKRKQRAANRSARDIDRSAAFIEKRLDLLKKIVKEIDRNYSGLISALVIESEDDLEAATTLRDILADSKEASAESLVSISKYRASTRALEEQNVSRTVRIACHRLAEALGGVEATFRSYEKSVSRLLRDFDKKLNEWQRQAA
jgi:hypothetical protein